MVKSVVALTEPGIPAFGASPDDAKNVLGYLRSSSVPAKLLEQIASIPGMAHISVYEHEAILTKRWLADGQSIADQIVPILSQALDVSLDDIKVELR